jgi:ABC-type tungstate transport system substrate-binding protein
MAKDKRLAEVARSLHRASERLWTRAADPEKYDLGAADVATLQRLTTDVSRAITKLKPKK